MLLLRFNFAVLLSSLLVLGACTDEKNAARQYGNTMVQSYKKAQDLDKKVNVQQVRTSIQEFYAANNRYPSDLNEITAFNGITIKSDNYDYNPATGTLAEKQ